MTKLIILLTIFLPAILLSQNVAINNDASLPDQSALLDISSTTKGLLIPRLTTFERTSIPGPAIGLTVFDIGTYTYWVYRGDINGGWREMLMDLDKRWQLNGSHIYNLNNGNVGIGTNTPASKLTINATDPAIDFMNAGTSKGYLQANGNDMKIGTYANNSTGNIVFNTKAVDRMWIDEAGKVGIATSTPNGALTIDGSNPFIEMRTSGVYKGYLWASGSDLRLGTSSTNTTGNLALQTKLLTRMIIDENGKVAIGTTTPSPNGIFTINDANPLIQLENNGVGKGFLQVVGNDLKIGTNTSNSEGKVHLVTGTSFDLTVDKGNVGIGTVNPDRKLKVVSNNTTGSQGVIHGEFTGPSTSAIGVVGKNVADPGVGTGVSGEGGNVGVEGRSDLAGSGARTGVAAFGWNGSSDNYGVASFGVGGQNTYGIRASGSGGLNTNYAGYFVGNVYTTGLYLPSDRKLKTGIVPLSGALGLINLLNPSAYNYNTAAYRHMHLPEGLQYGLIADELKRVIPSAVTKAVQPAEYENHDRENGNKLSESIEFNAINYTAMVPILIAAVKEQQQMIEDLKKEIIEMKKLMK